MRNLVYKAARRFRGGLPTENELSLPTRDALLAICGSADKAFDVLYPRVSVELFDTCIRLQTLGNEYIFNRQLLAMDQELVLGVEEATASLTKIRKIGRLVTCFSGPVRVSLMAKTEHITVDYFYPEKQLTPIMWRELYWVRCKCELGHVHYSVRLDLR